MNRTHYIVALFPIIFLIILLSINVSLYGDDSLGGANQLALILAGAVAGIIGIKSGTNWKSIIDGISNSIKSVTPSIIILLLIGSLACCNYLFSSTFLLIELHLEYVYYHKKGF